MAERVVSSVLQLLADPLIRESLLVYGVRDETEWLQEELQWMKCFLIDAEAKRMRGNELIKNWLRKVREVAEEAEDIIDTFTLQIQLKKRPGLLRRIKRYAAFPCEVKSRHKVGTEIKGLKAKIDHIRESRERYGLVSLIDQTTPLADEAHQTRRRIYPHLDHSTLVFGLDLHKKEIVDRLLNPAIKRRSVVSVVGIGGLGKTTLANKVYNHSEIKARFHVSACISVSQDYKVHDIYKELVRQMMGKTMAELQSKDVVELSEMLREFLINRRYLILLDDVWSEDVWGRLVREALPEENNGSRVLLTTRNMDLATSIDRTIPPYKLPFLNEDESWALFLNKAFLPDESCSEELEGIGRRLVKRCGGLPLALEVLGGILSLKKPNSVAWTSVSEHFDWGSTDKGGECSKILKLSYNNLPHHHLKSCFLYLGVFPEDSVIGAQQLIELWIAEGFIPQLEGQLMEDTAHAYLEELANRSMIQVVYKDWLGSSAIVSSLRIHDLFRDLCIREARENDFFNIYSMTSNSTTTSTTLQDTINIHGEIRTLRHLYLDRRGTGNIGSFTLADVGSLTNLQTLDVDIDASVGWMERGFEKLVNIRILKVRYLKEEQARVFIDSVRKMKYLSYLELKSAIPREILSDLSENNRLREMLLWGPMSVQQLPESLHGFPPNLTTLRLMRSELSQDPMATLEKLPYLRKLSLTYKSYIGKEMVCTSGGFPRLQELDLYQLDELEEWRVEDGAMPNLTVLDIQSCKKLRMLPPGRQRSLTGTLTNWVRREIGEYWYEIKNVPNILVT